MSAQRFATHRFALPFGLVLSFALMGAACSSSSDDEGESAATTAAVSTDQADSTETTATTVAEVADLPGLPMADGVEIQQLTDRTGGGPRPLLMWEPVAAATSYTVVLYDAAEDAWWSWSGTETSIVVGGVSTDIEIGGPRADTDARWSVMAFDDTGNLVGTSPKRSLEP